MEWLAALVTLTAMEIVLGIDNIVFLTILVGRLPEGQRSWARKLGMGLALGTRLLLLFAINWIMGLTATIFSLSDWGIPQNWLSEEVNKVSWRDVILMGGGLFLIFKATREIHHKLEGEHGDELQQAPSRFLVVIVEIAILDIVFSLDSVITAVGMAKDLWVMVTAMIIAVGVMLWFAGPLDAFVRRHPTVKMLALSFLILIGVMLVAEGSGTHIDRGYVYFAMGFSLLVELLNLRVAAKAPPDAMESIPG